MIQGVIFDLDGVLVTTDELHYRSWKQLADSLGVYFDRTINNRLRGVSRMRSLEIMLERSDRAFSDEEKAMLADRKNDSYRRPLQTLSPAHAMPGARDLLAALRDRNIKVAVASSSKNAPLILERLGWSDAFDAVADGNEITRSKPDPEVFLLAAGRLGLSPADCVVVEDAAAGIEAARRAGMAAFGIGTPQTLPGVGNLAPDLKGVTVDMLLEAGARS